jgi:hypothetical protein
VELFNDSFQDREAEPRFSTPGRGHFGGGMRGGYGDGGYGGAGAGAGGGAGSGRQIFVSNVWIQRQNFSSINNLLTSTTNSYRTTLDGKISRIFSVKLVSVLARGRLLS